jgi:hypothetical protein
MDHRCRKRDCKHILLCAREVGLLDDGAGAGGGGGRAGALRRGVDWRACVRAAVERLGAADEADVREVRRKDAARREQEERRRRKKEGAGGGGGGGGGAVEEEEAAAAAAAAVPLPASGAGAAAAAAAEQRVKSRPDLKPALAFM